jgi:type IV pilus assembly protein PilC
MEDVKSWVKIRESIDGDPLFPDMMVQMIQVWEQTATLDKTIIKVADFYDEQFTVTIATINKLIEPIIIVFLAVTVWFIAISIMQPIMWLADQISNS